MRKKQADFLQAISHLLRAGSFNQTAKEVVIQAKNLSDAQGGALFTLEKGKLKKIYATSSTQSFEEPLLKKSLMSQSLQVIQGEQYSIALLPLLVGRKKLGVVVLYASQKNFFIQKKKDILEVYQQFASPIVKIMLQYAQAQQALARREQFISFAAHEIRNPLTAINGYIQLLYSKKQKDNSPEFRWVKELYGESTRFTLLVKELLNVKKIKQRH